MKRGTASHPGPMGGGKGIMRGTDMTPEHYTQQFCEQASATPCAKQLFRQIGSGSAEGRAPRRSDASSSSNSKARRSLLPRKRRRPRRIASGTSCAEKARCFWGPRPLLSPACGDNTGFSFCCCLRSGRRSGPWQSRGGMRWKRSLEGSAR